MSILTLAAVLASEPAPKAEASPAITADIVDALKANAGNPKGARASFAKGQCVRGYYEAAPQAAVITKSQSFTQSSQLLGRFAVGGGNPHVADTNRTVLRGFSFRLGQPGHTTDLLVENAPVHFAKSVDQMLAFLKARTPGPDGKPDHDRVKAFSDENPETLNQANYIAARPLPASFAGTTFWGVHSFPATNSHGKSRYIKFKLVPLAGQLTLTEEDSKEKSADFLLDDLAQRIANHTARFDVMALLGRPGDPTLDVTRRWPDEDARKAVRLGTISITALEGNQHCDEMIFNPASLADGIGHPPDEMFAARTLAYAMSLAKRRTGGAE